MIKYLLIIILCLLFFYNNDNFNNTNILRYSNIIPSYSSIPQPIYNYKKVLISDKNNEIYELVSYYQLSFAVQKIIISSNTINKELNNTSNLSYLIDNEIIKFIENDIIFAVKQSDLIDSNLVNNSSSIIFDNDNYPYYLSYNNNIKLIIDTIMSSDRSIKNKRSKLSINTNKNDNLKILTISIPDSEYNIKKNNSFSEVVYNIGDSNNISGNNIDLIPFNVNNKSIYLVSLVKTKTDYDLSFKPF